MAGQNARYIENELKAFADGMRSHAVPMNAYAKHIGEEQRKALAAFLQTLRVATVGV